MSLYHISAAFIMGWSWFSLVTPKCGIIGKFLHFAVTLEAGAICFPATLGAEPSQSIVVFLSAIILYNEVSRCAAF